MAVRPLLLAMVFGRTLIGESKGARRFNRRLPARRRCKSCYVPFSGPCAVPFRLFQVRPSRKNPNLCVM